MKKKRWQLIICFLLAAGTVLGGDPPESEADLKPALLGKNGPTVSGFIDLRAMYSSEFEAGKRFSVDQAEIDLEQSISSRLNSFVAVAYNNESGSFELGTAVLDIDLLNNTAGFFNDVRLGIGQFDVPFGIGHRYYAPPDCEAVCSPWYSHHVGNWSGWNDYGLKLGATTTSGSLDLFVVNGYEESEEIVHSVFNLATGLTEDSIELDVTVPEAAFGGRIGLAVVPSNLELGVSASTGVDDQGSVAMTLLGNDITINSGKLGLRGELIYSTVKHNSGTEISRGAYLIAHYDLAPVRLLGRYATLRDGNEDWSDQYAAGAGFALADQTELRGELVKTSNDRMAVILQVVAGF